MKYQLVIQWAASTLEDHDALIAIEDLLIETLSKAHKVDGHDMGSDECNIFIHTDDPRRAFEEAQTVVAGREIGCCSCAAYRQLAGEEYTVLWPPGLSEFRLS